MTAISLADSETPHVYCVNCGAIVARLDLPLLAQGPCDHDWLPYGGPGPETSPTDPRVLRNKQYIVEVADDWSGASLEVTADCVARACGLAIKRFARDRSRPLDLDTCRMQATEVVA